MFESIVNFFKKLGKTEKDTTRSKDAAKERLHLVLMQDRANVSADFLDLMKQEIIEVIKKYIDIDEEAMDVRLTNKQNDDGTTGAPALYANIPIMTIKDEARKKAKVFQKEDSVEEKRNNDCAEIQKESNNEDKTETVEENEENVITEEIVEEKIEEAENLEKGSDEEKVVDTVKTENA